MNGEFKHIDDVCVKRLQAHDFAAPKHAAAKRVIIWVTVTLLMTMFLYHCTPVGA